MLFGNSFSGGGSDVCNNNQNNNKIKLQQNSIRVYAGKHLMYQGIYCVLFENFKAKANFKLKEKLKETKQCASSTLQVGTNRILLTISSQASDFYLYILHTMNETIASDAISLILILGIKCTNT